ncbi:MAG: hypothetical protein K8R02_04805 [Anaerohalosphaeraceae bacterium]|nr:hypothetical protein [Anaerohalosphaeraceae bacterium]
MITLTKEQKDIILDYYFGCAPDDEAAQARSLVSSHQGAAEFLDKLDGSLSPLAHLGDEDAHICPEHLVGATLEKLDFEDTTSASERLGELLDVEKQKPVTTSMGFWRRAFEMAAIAAMVIFVSGLFVPVTRHMRAQAWKTACSLNLSKIANGITSYASDNNNQLPTVATSPGEAWWKVGSETKNNQSNTRHLWLLVQRGYLRPEVFVCPGSTGGKLARLNGATLKNYRDFPNKRYISYSFKLICDPTKASLPQRSVVLMADSNPIFSNSLGDAANCDKSEFTPVKLCERLMKINSRNHYKKGQNVMFSDGAVLFLKRRTVADGHDDIFTVKGLDVYRGIEVPSSETDIFLVP